MESGVRLQKVLASAGLGSRRVCDDLVAAGRVTVDGAVATPGTRVDPEAATIRVDGERVVTGAKLIHLALHKPRGVLSAMSDDRGRPTLADFLPATRQERIYHVGRLDADSEGLLLLTNDGDLAHRLTHPSFGVQKLYLCEVRGDVNPALGRRLRAGVTLEDGQVKVDRFAVKQATKARSLVEVTLHEGRNHIVRRLLEEVGHPVTRLIRTALGPIRLGDLPAGRTRPLSRPELASLYAAVDL